MQPIAEPPPTPDLIRSRYDHLLARLRAAAASEGRDPDGFRIVAVTKGFGVDVVRAALAAGLTMLGENRVQEAAAKVEAAPEADWHMIGQLQSNKVRQALRLFGTVHSVDSVALLDRIDRIAHDDGRAPRVLLQVDMSGRAGRGGFPAAEFAELATDRAGALVTRLVGLVAARPIGLMTVAPIDPGAERRTFGRLRELRDRLRATSGLELPELSMGMTADAEAAVREGATLLRIGTALFGPRPERH
ncbi:MAG TPA: YggS family pyridoxal phosphate-dependent enzyme [Candidatus Limnocylindria bacterium]|jgi:pyridoxal phosphate enzyme (YggS family)